jgi:hypothetical protein
MYALSPRIKLCGKLFTCHNTTVMAITSKTTKFFRGNKSLLLRYPLLHLPPLTTKTSVASACIATQVNGVITSSCHAWQRTTMVARKGNSCNAKLAMVANSFCNATFCDHWQRTRFGCNIYLLQPNWTYCNVFLSLRKGQNLVV